MKNKLSIALTMALIAAILGTSLALADQVVNDLDLSVDAEFETMSLNVGGSNGTTTLKIVEQNGDGKNGCNLTGPGSQLTVSAASSNTAVATVSPTLVTFNACGDTRVLTVTPVGEGSVVITLDFVSVTTSSGGVTSSSFDLLPGRFTVNVAPPPNTAPVVTVTGVSHGASYEFGTVPTAGCTVEDAEDGSFTFAADLGPISGSLSGYGLGSQTATCSYTDSGGLTTTMGATYEIVDTTAPTITYVSRTPTNANGWNNTDVTVNWSCSDNVGVVSTSVSQTLSGEGTNQSVIGTCEDLVGLTASDTVTGINIDKTAPAVAVTGVANGATYTLGSIPAAGCNTTDALSGVATPASLSMSGGLVGSVTATCNGALDNAGNPGSASVTYNVIYNWTGFFQPIDNNMLNTAKGGSGIPVKFSLSGNQGLSIFAADYPKSVTISCDTNAPTDEIETTVTAGGSSLSYDALADQYVYVWKTEKSWANTCRQLQVMLNDGTLHTANFKFK